MGYHLIREQDLWCFDRGREKEMALRFPPYLPLIVLCFCSSMIMAYKDENPTAKTMGDFSASLIPTTHRRYDQVPLEISLYTKTISSSNFKNSSGGVDGEVEKKRVVTYVKEKGLGQETWVRVERLEKGMYGRCRLVMDYMVEVQIYGISGTVVQRSSSRNPFLKCADVQITIDRGTTSFLLTEYSVNLVE